MDKEMKDMFELVLKKFDHLELRLDRLESRMDNLESRQDEIFMAVKAIEHNNQVHGAELDR